MKGATREKRTTVAILALAALCMLGTGADAGWLSSLMRETAEIGEGSAGRAARAVELAPLESAAAYLEKLPSGPGTALAAHATSEGHWQFINRDGQTFTVGTPDEMTRVVTALAPDAAARGDTKMTLYLSEDSVFANRAALDELPPDANLNVVADGTAYRISQSWKDANVALKAYLTANIAIELRDQRAFEETVFLLNRPLNKSNIRTVAFETGAAAPLSSAPKLDPMSKVPLVDQIDPGKLDDGLSSLRRQTALVTGRVEGGNLIAATSSGEIAIPMDRLTAATRANDVNLVILQSDSSKQAGGRNWLWQKIKIGGLDAASEASTFGDFLDALAARRGGFLVNPSRDASDRVQISAVPDASATAITSDATNIFEELVSHVTGEVVTNAVSVDARDRDTQSELDLRLIPWLPAGVQFSYLAGIVAGIAGWSTSRNWWFKALSAIGQSNAPGNRRAIGRIISGLAFFLVFLPVVGFPAFVVQTLHQIITIVLAPFRWIRRRFLLKHV